MSVHPAGTGSEWVEDIDVDQPHGLDYRSWNHLAKAVRKRIEKGHTAFADSTVGGNHIPGGSGILGMEITNAGGDVTAVVVSDGTYMGRGLVWAWDGSQDARLWCSTADAESTAATDFTLMKLNPDKQWGGGDVTWAGNHQFDASVDMTSLNVFGSVCVQGVLNCGSDVNIAENLQCASGATFVNTLACSSKAAIVGDVSCSAGLIVDGTIVADGTGHSFGGTAGIALFFDPTSYTGGESITFPNGLIVKRGTTAGLGAGSQAVAFAAAFPTECLGVWANNIVNGITYSPNVHTITAANFTVYRQGAYDIYWLAVGR